MSTIARMAVAATLSVGVVAGLSTAASAGNNGAFWGGLAVGALAGAAIAGATPAPVYGGPVYAPPVYSSRRCWLQAQPVFSPDGYQVGTQTVQRCNY